VLLTLLLSACGGAPDDTLPPDPGPAVRACPAAPAGGWLLVKSLEVDEPPGPAALDGAALEERWSAPADVLHHLYRVPDLAPGTVELTVGGASLAFDVTEPGFGDVAADIGLDAPHDVSDADPACSEAQTGVGFADVDADGDLDGFFGGFSSPTRAYENLGGPGLPQFVDSALAWGFPDVDKVAGVFFADWDDDGDPDLLLARLGTNVALENRLIPDGAPGWRDVTALSGLGTTDQRTMGFGFGDYDGDGDLDVYEVNHSRCFPDGDPKNDQLSADHLWRNDGDHVFTDVSALLNPDVMDRFGFTAIWLDLDRDADQDLWVVNDWTTGSGRSAVWRNDGPDGADGWSFTEITAESGISPAFDVNEKTINAMGGAVGDLNRDGLPDFAFTNIGPNQLTVSDPSGTWHARAHELGLSRGLQAWDKPSVTWGAHLADLDLDRDLDVVYVGGALKGGDPQPHALFENLGTTFVERTWEAGLSSPRHGKASAQLDLDGDGHLELVVANWGAPPEVWHNLAGDRVAHHWLAIDPVGDGDRVNRDGFGAIVELSFDDGVVETCFHNPVPSLGGTSDPACWFGLGSETSVTGAVIWPDGTVAEIPISGVDRRVEVAR
jgi:enediyne biosynthesis protein E4